MLVNISTSNFSDLIDTDKIKNLIIADIKARLTTLGSYVGEVSILEVLNLIKRKYNIDENRVYFTGYSTGAYGSWVMAQNYPHLCTGILPVGGEPNVHLWQNSSNVGVVNAISDCEHLYKDKHLFANFKPLNSYFEVIVRGLMHSDIYIIQYKRFWETQIFLQLRSIRIRVI